MKHLLIIIAFIALSATTTFAEIWLVFIDRGDETIVIIMREKPFVGEGVTVLGPFPDQEPPSVNNTSVGAQTYTTINEAPAPKPSITSPKNAEAYLAYKKNGQVNVIQFSENSDWQGIKDWINDNDGCTSSGFNFFFRQNGNGNTLKINGKEVNVRKEPVTVSYGDILINNEPIDFE